MTNRVDIFKQMLETDPQNGVVMFGLANEYLKLEKHAEAAELLQKYVEHETDEGAAYGMLARAYHELGHKDQARAAFERGIEVALAHNHPSMAEDYRMMLSVGDED
ncbi:MAG: tetratricopeptide repeat protein [Pyrinomonadaceae bacterium]